MITSIELKTLLDYDPLTGHFQWKVSRGVATVGKIAGCVKANGYRYILIYGKAYFAHKLAWFYTYGEWPKGCIDHANGLKDDNRIDNLRVVTPRENSQNKISHREGKLVGCHWHKQHKKFCASIRIPGRTVTLGLFTSEQEAHDRYKEALDHLDDLVWFDQFKRKKPKGYYWRKDVQKWQANGWKDNKTVYLGCYDTEEEASRAYRTFLESNK